ncbi:S-layer homology domain-containing protein [Demequina oxidasica]|uniref:CAP and S-layer homology domain-containing protein n=1 Tax=Demequina oxidasica TaxID=676199 RepID=UPI000781E5B0|nr:S-layer homology domain-containing protein [Demequina oxidasica]
MAHKKSDRVRIAGLVLVATVAGALAMPGAAQAASSSTQVGSDYILDATNSYRGSNGRGDLTRDGSIDYVAQRWAQKMLASDTLAHNPSYGDQMPQQGLGAWGENVAYACGYGGVKANSATIMSSWKKSDGHRKNMLNGSYTHIGIGFAYDGRSDCAFAVQDFGKYSSTFTDVPRSHQFSFEIEWLVDREITTGYSNGHFQPQSSVTREAFAAFLYRIEGAPSYSPPSKSPFRDVSPGDKFYKEITWLADEGITTGYADGSFKPDEHISRQAIAAFLYRAAGKVATTDPTSAPFRDVGRSDQFATEIQWLDRSGITTGFSDGTFRPYDDVSRVATAAFLYRGRTIIGR